MYFWKCFLWILNYKVWSIILNIPYMAKLSRSQRKELNNRCQRVTHKMYSISASGYLDKGKTIILKIILGNFTPRFHSKLTYILSYYFIIGIKSFHLEIKITIFLRNMLIVLHFYLWALPKVVHKSTNL